MNICIVGAYPKTSGACFDTMQGMQTAAKKLPDDVETLKSLPLSTYEHSDSLQHRNETLLKENRRFRARAYTPLQAQLNLTLARRYGASSEKAPTGVSSSCSTKRRLRSPGRRSEQLDIVPATIRAIPRCAGNTPATAASA